MLSRCAANRCASRHTDQSSSQAFVVMGVLNLKCASESIEGSICAGVMYSKLPDEVNAGTYNRVASLWFVAMVVIFQAGKIISTTPDFKHK